MNIRKDGGRNAGIWLESEYFLRAEATSGEVSPENLCFTARRYRLLTPDLRAVFLS